MKEGQSQLMRLSNLCNLESKSYDRWHETGMLSAIPFQFRCQIGNDRFHDIEAD